MTKRQPFFHNARVATAFLTRIPVSHGDQLEMGCVARWFPTVGLFIGSCAAGTLWALEVLVGHRVAAVAVVLVGVLVTGGFHHDGLADSADGLVGGWTPEQRRQILKDSRHGTYGVLALVLQVVLQVSAVGAMPLNSAIPAVVLMHCLGRAAAVSVMRSGEGITEGLGANYVAGVRVRDISVALVSSVMFGVAIAGVSALVAFICALVVARGVIKYAVSRIGGIVGDVLGATEQVAESTVLLVAMVFVEHFGGFGW
ncbi:MAG: adenosylcobinamide-GDP ribazoletransferase [Actinomycetota bacterium]